MRSAVVGDEQLRLDVPVVDRLGERRVDHVVHVGFVLGHLERLLQLGLVDASSAGGDHCELTSASTRTDRESRPEDQQHHRAAHAGDCITPEVEVLLGLARVGGQHL
jgi:hypothetical protein